MRTYSVWNLIRHWQWALIPPSLYHTVRTKEPAKFWLINQEPRAWREKNLHCSGIASSFLLTTHCVWKVTNVYTKTRCFVSLFAFLWAPHMSPEWISSLLWMPFIQSLVIFSSRRTYAYKRIFIRVFFQIGSFYFICQLILFVGLPSAHRERHWLIGRGSYNDQMTLSKCSRTHWTENLRPNPNITW
jgi:hypothetical protein